MSSCKASKCKTSPKMDNHTVDRLGCGEPIRHLKYMSMQPSRRTTSTTAPPSSYTTMSLSHRRRRPLRRTYSLFDRHSLEESTVWIPLKMSHQKLSLAQSHRMSNLALQARSNVKPAQKSRLSFNRRSTLQFLMALLQRLPRRPSKTTPTPRMTLRLSAKFSRRRRTSVIHLARCPHHRRLRRHRRPLRPILQGMFMFPKMDICRRKTGIRCERIPSPIPATRAMSPCLSPVLCRKKSPTCPPSKSRCM